MFASLGMGSVSVDTDLPKGQRILQYVGITLVPLLLPVPPVFYVVLLISALAVAFTHVTSTCISREGKNFPYMKTMPVPMEMQLAVKSRIGLYMAIAGALPFLVIINFACLVLSVNLLFVPVSLILSMSVLVLGNDVQMYLDCSSPILSWENEYAAATNNLGAP